MAQQAPAAVTVCPECGAKIPKAGMSLCPYCASPLQATKADDDRNPIVERLKKMEDKPEFGEAQQTTTPWTPEYAQARNRQGQGTVLAIVGVLLAGLEVVLGFGGAQLYVLGGLLAVGGVLMAVIGTSKRGKLDAMKVLKRSAYLVRRRSETGLEKGGDVVYHFLIQFGDGSEGEFRYPGRGVNEELYSNGMTGVAFTRGDELLHIERVRI